MSNAAIPKMSVHGTLRPKANASARPQLVKADAELA